MGYCPSEWATALEALARIHRQHQALTPAQFRARAADLLRRLEQTDVGQVVAATAGYVLEAKAS